MSRLDTWRKRFRITGDQKPKVRVQTTRRLETMTVTQEWRFKQLQRFRFEERNSRESVRGTRAWYTLAEASQRLVTSSKRLLRAAAAGDFACYVATDGLRGRWRGSSGRDETGIAARAIRADVSHLRLPRETCRDIETYGSVNVTVLKHPTAEGKSAHFLLQEPLWVAPDRILLKHPLPAIRRD